MTGKALLTVRQRDKNNICEEKQAEKNRSYPNLTTTSDLRGINVNGPTLSLSLCLAIANILIPRDPIPPIFSNSQSQTEKPIGGK